MRRALILALLASILSSCATTPGAREKAPPRWSTEKKVRFYIGKLKDPTYTTTYGHGYTWYTAAEELGRIGKPAIPDLVARLDTSDAFERTLVLYALLLASQDASLKSATGGEYSHVHAWDRKKHPESVEIARDWWERWKHLW